MLRPLRRLGVPLACLALLVVSQQAKADFRVVLTQTGSGSNPAPLTLHDTLGLGVISKVTPYGAFSLFTLIATSNYPGTPGGAMLNTVSIDTRNGTNVNKTLTIQVFSDATTGAGFGPPAEFTQPGTNGSTLMVKSEFDVSLLQGTGTYDSKIDSTSLAQLGPGGTDTISYVRGASYTLSGKVTLTLGASKSAAITATTTTTASAVPAPGGMTLLLSGLPIVGAGFFYFRRRNKAQLVPVS